MPPFRSEVDRRRFVLRAAAMTAAFASTVAHGSDGYGAGEVELVKGEASAFSGSARRLLHPRDPIFIDELVGTGAEARLALKLGQRTWLKLGERTQIKVDRYLVDAGGEIELIDGAILFERVGPPADSELSFRSPFGLIAVRGTRFYAGRSNGVFGVLVGRGRVEVRAGGQTVTVEGQQGTDIATAGGPPTPPKAWALPRIRHMQKLFL